MIAIPYPAPDVWSATTVGANERFCLSADLSICDNRVVTCHSKICRWVCNLQPWQQTSMCTTCARTFYMHHNTSLAWMPCSTSYMQSRSHVQRARVHTQWFLSKLWIPVSVDFYLWVEHEEAAYVVIPLWYKCLAVRQFTCDHDHMHMKTTRCCMTRVHASWYITEVPFSQDYVNHTVLTDWFCDYKIVCSNGPEYFRRVFCSFNIVACLVTSREHISCIQHSSTHHDTDRESFLHKT